MSCYAHTFQQLRGYNEVLRAKSLGEPSEVKDQPERSVGDVAAPMTDVPFGKLLAVLHISLAHSPHWTTWEDATPTKRELGVSWRLAGHLASFS